MYGSNTLVPTYEDCFLQDTNDAFLLIQSVIDKQLPITRARPTEQNRRELIKSGNVFVIDMKENYIARWTDGLTWSPSRILGDFLIYRERRRRRQSSRSSIPKKSVHSIPNTEPEVASRVRGNVPNYNSLMSSYDLGVVSPPHILARQEGHDGYFTGQGTSSSAFRGSQVETSGTRTQSSEYNLYGSLTSNDQYKEDGLIKKTFSVPYRQSVFRLVSYYLPKDVETGKLRLPSRDPRFANVRISDELSETKNVRMPVAIPHGDLFHGYEASSDLLYSGNPPDSYGLYQERSEYNRSPTAGVPSSRVYGRSGSFMDGDQKAVKATQSSDYSDESGALDRRLYFKDSPLMQNGMQPRPQSSSSVSTIQPGRQPLLPRGALHTRPTPMAQLATEYDGGHVQERHLNGPAFTGVLKLPRHRTKRNSMVDYSSTPAGLYSTREHLQLDVREVEKHRDISPSFRLNEFEDKSSEITRFGSGSARARSDIFNTVTPDECNPLQGEVGQSGKISASVISQESDTYDQLYRSMSPRSDQAAGEMSNSDQERFYAGNSIESSARPLESTDAFAPGQPQQAIFLPPTTTAPYDMPRH